jgi:hypothetical protein
VAVGCQSRPEVEDLLEDLLDLGDSRPDDDLGLEPLLHKLGTRDSWTLMLACAKDQARRARCDPK